MSLSPGLGARSLMHLLGVQEEDASLLGVPWSPEDSELRHSRSTRNRSLGSVVTHTAPRWGRGDGPQREGLIQSRRARVPRGGTAWGAVPAPRSSPGFLWIAVARTSATLHCGRGSGESAQPVRSGPLPRQAAERPSRTERGRRRGRGAACGGDVRFAHSHLLCQLTRCSARGFRPRPGT